MLLFLVTTLAVCLGVQIIYLTATVRAFESYHPPAEHGSPNVSVIVCARNEAHNLRGVVSEIAAQQYAGNFEIIVVDDRSTDASAEILQALASAYKNLRVITIGSLPTGYNGKKFALRKGISMARHEFILLTDADCRPDGIRWISTMMAAYSGETDIVLGFSGYTPGPGLLNGFIYYETLVTAMQYLGSALRGRPYMGVGRNLSYRRSLFTDGNGFSGIEHLTGGDDDLFIQRHATASNTRVVIGRNATTWSAPARTVGDYFSQKVRHLSAGRNYTPTTRMKLGVNTISHIFGYVTMGVLLFIPGGGLWAVSGIIVRTLSVVISFKKACQKLELPFFAGNTLLMDLIYPVYYLVFGVSALVRNRIRWK